MHKLGITEYYPGVTDKKAFIKDYCHREGCNLSQIAYMGDDLNDLDCLKVVGFAACPADAVDAVRNVCHFKAARSAGTGAVREVCDHILKLKHD
jgi:N-acylneuraminate cytidylyltransferase